MSWKKIVKSIAPTIGTALGGPMAGTAIKFIAGKLLGNEGATEQDIDSFVSNAGPDQLLPLKQMDNDFKIKMAELGVNVFKLEVQDRMNARLHNKDSVMPAIICLLLTVMVGLGTYGLMVMDVPTENANIIYMVFGQVLTAWAGSIAYWVGTTKSSADKTKLMGKINA